MGVYKGMKYDNDVGIYQPIIMTYLLFCHIIMLYVILASNTLPLNNCFYYTVYIEDNNQRITEIYRHLLSQKPDCIIMTFLSDHIYSGLADGRLVKMNPQTGEVTTVVQQLGVPPCGKIHFKIFLNET